MRFLPFVILVVAAGWLASQWDALPERWVIHWGPGGVPDGFASKTLGGVFGPLLFAAGLAVFFELVAVFLERATRARVPLLAHAYGNLVRWVSLGVVVSLAATAVLLPMAASLSPRVIVGMVLGAIVLALVAGGWGLAAAVRQMKAQGESLPKGYGPFIYRNPDDPRLIVPKLVGIGWTFNFARPAAWILLALLLLPAIAALIAVFAIAG